MPGRPAPGGAGRAPGGSGRPPGPTGRAPGGSGLPSRPMGRAPGGSGRAPGGSGRTPGGSGRTPGGSGLPSRPMGRAPGGSGRDTQGAAGARPAGADEPQAGAACRHDPQVAAALAAQVAAARHPAARGGPGRHPAVPDAVRHRAGPGVADRRPAARGGSARRPAVRRPTGPRPAGRVAPARPRTARNGPGRPTRPDRRRRRNEPARGGRPGPAGTGRSAPGGRRPPTNAACRPRPGSPSTNGSWPPPPWRTAWQAGPWTGPQALWRSHTPAGCSTRSHFLVITRAGRRLARRLAQHSVLQCLDGGVGRHRVGHLQGSLDAAPPYRHVQALWLPAQIGATTGRLPGRVVGDRPGWRTHDPMEGTLRSRHPAYHTRPPWRRSARTGPPRGRGGIPLPSRRPDAGAPRLRLITCNAW